MTTADSPVQRSGLYPLSTAFAPGIVARILVVDTAENLVARIWSLFLLTIVTFSTVSPAFPSF